MDKLSPFGIIVLVAGILLGNYSGIGGLLATLRIVCERCFSESGDYARIPNLLHGAV